jgi:hypothetical protein
MTPVNERLRMTVDSRGAAVPEAWSSVNPKLAKSADAAFGMPSLTFGDPQVIAALERAGRQQRRTERRQAALSTGERRWDSCRNSSACRGRRDVGPGVQLGGL